MRICRISDTGGAPGEPSTFAVAGSSRRSMAAVYGTPKSECTSRAMPTMDMQSGRFAVMYRSSTTSLRKCATAWPIGASGSKT